MTSSEASKTTIHDFKYYLVNLQNLMIRDIPKEIPYEDIDELTKMTKETKRGTNTISFGWNSLENKISKLTIRYSNSSGKTVSKPTSSIVKAKITKDMIPLKEIMKKIKASLKTGFILVNVETAETDISNIVSPFKNILNYTSSDYNWDSKVDSYYYVVRDFDLDSNRYREIPVNDDSYSHVIGFDVSGVFKAFDLKVKTGYTGKTNFKKRNEYIKNHFKKFKMLKIEYVEEKMPLNIEKYKYFEDVNQEKIKYVIIIGPCIESQQYYFMTKFDRICPVITLAGNAKGGEIKSGSGCYVGWNMPDGTSYKTKTSIKSIWKNYEILVGKTAQIFTTVDKKGKQNHYIQSVYDKDSNTIIGQDNDSK